MKFTSLLPVLVLSLISLQAIAINFDDYKGFFNSYENSKGTFWDKNRVDLWIYEDGYVDACNKLVSGYDFDISVCQKFTDGDWVRSGCVAEWQDHKILMSKCPKAYPNCSNEKYSANDGLFNSLRAKCCDVKGNCVEVY